MIRSLHDVFAYCVVGFGVYLAHSSPAAGAAIVLCGFAYSAGRLAIEQVDSRRAAALIDTLQHVVNANAKRLEEVILQVNKIEGDLAFSSTARGMGLK